MSKNNNEDFYNTWLIQRFYSEESLYSMNLDEIVLGVLKNLKQKPDDVLIKTVTYYNNNRSDFKTNKGKVVSVRGSVITFLVKNRKYKYKLCEIWAYHPAIYAALCIATGFTPHLKYKWTNFSITAN